MNPILSSDNNLNSISANTSKSSSPQPPLNRNLNNDDDTSHTLMHDKNNRKLSQTSFNNNNNNTSLLLNSVDISNNGIFIDINNKLSVSPSHNSTTTTTTTTTTTLTKGSKLKNFSKKILKRVNSNNPTFMNKNMNKQNKISQDQDENNTNNNNNRRNSSGSIELFFDPNSHIINDDHTSKYQQHQDNNSISGRRSNGNSRLKQQKTLNSSVDIKEFERKLINLPTFTISDEYSRSFFPNSNSTASFAATGGGVGEASSVSTEIVCFKNHSDLIQLPTELRNSTSDLIKINNIDLMKKKTTTTTITTTTTTTIMKTAESIPFIVTSPPSPIPLPTPPTSTATTTTRRNTNTNNNNNNYGSSGRSRSASIVFISNNLINNRKTNSNSKINYSRRKSDFSTNEIINHLAKKNSMSDKQLNHIKKCKIIIENDSNSNTIVNPNGSLNSVKARSSARSLSAIPYLLKHQLDEQEELKRRNSSCMTNMNMKSDSPNVVNKAIKSLKNILRSHDNIDNKSRNSLGPVVGQQTKGGISNSYTEMSTYLSNKNIANTNNTTTSTNNNDLLDTPPNLIRRVRSNSASFFTQVRNSISLGASSGIHTDDVSNTKNEKPKGFKLFQSNEKLKKTNKSNNDL